MTDTDEKKMEHLKHWDATVRQCVKKVSNEIRNTESELPNFAVMDQKAIRYEVDQEQATAAFSANNPQYAEPAFAWFQTLKRGALPLSIGS